MPNQSGNGRNATGPDENRPSWQPSDQEVRGRDPDPAHDTDRGGMGQSGYGAGRRDEDRAFGAWGRNHNAQSHHDRESMGLDERFTGHGNPEHHRASGGYGGGRGFEDRGRDDHGGYDDRFGHPRPGGQQGSYGQQHVYGPQQGFGPSGPHGWGQRAPQAYNNHQRVQRDDHRGGSDRGDLNRAMQTFRGKGPKGYTRSDDRIRELVCEALSDDHDIDASDIEVQVKSGEVTLTGFVPDRRMKRCAEDCTERVPGVHDIQNQIRVQDRQNANRGNPPANGSVSTPDTDVGDKR